LCIVCFIADSALYYRTFFVHGFVSLRFNGWSSLIRFGNMDLLVALSTGVAYVASIIMMAIDVRKGPMELKDKDDPMRTYFDAVVLLSFFILMGRALEGRARLKVRLTCSPSRNEATDLMHLDR
jgi:cation transport ATPase